MCPLHFSMEVVRRALAAAEARYREKSDAADRALSILGSLPPNVAVRVLSFLDERERAAVSSLCKSVWEASRHPSLWESVSGTCGGSSWHEIVLSSPHVKEVTECEATEDLLPFISSLPRGTTVHFPGETSLCMCDLGEWVAPNHRMEELTVTVCCDEDAEGVNWNAVRAMCSKLYIHY